MSVCIRKFNNGLLKSNNRSTTSKPPSCTEPANPRALAGTVSVETVLAELYYWPTVLGYCVH